MPNYSVEAVKVIDNYLDGRVRIINKSDFDAERHALFSEDKNVPDHGRELLEDRYLKIFGKKASAKMKDETLLAKIQKWEEENPRNEEA